MDGFALLGALIERTGKPAHQVTHQGLGNAHVDVVHRHVVTVVGGPTQSQLRQVARAQHEAVDLVGEVHQNLGALTCLAVFIGHVVVIRIVADVLEMLSHCSGDADLMQRHAQRLDHGAGIGVSAVGGAEARHGDGMDVLAVASHAVKRPHGNQQRQRRVQASRNAHDNRLDASEFQAAHQSFGLYGDNFLATGIQAVILGRDERQTANGSQQFLLLVVQRTGNHHRDALERCPELHHAVGKAAVDAALVLEGSHVDVGDGHLGLGGEALTLGEHLAVLGNDGVAAKDEVGR